jgi:hypothetical protein
MAFRLVFDGAPQTLTEMKLQRWNQWQRAEEERQRQKICNKVNRLSGTHSDY